LLAGVDYSGGNIAADTVDESTNTDGAELTPLVFIKRHGSDPVAWQLAEKYGETPDIPALTEGDDTRWSAHVIVPPNSHSIRIMVTGADQQVLFGEDFNNGKLVIDPSTSLLNPADGELIAVLCLPHGRRVEGEWPAALAAGVDAPVIREFDFGDSYTATYVAPNTPLGVKSDGSLDRSSGGWIPKQGNDDNFARLAAAARQLFAYYSQDRHAISLQTQHMFGADDLQIGDLVTTVGEVGSGHRQEVNTFVSQIEIHHPIGTGDNPPSPSFRVVTAAGELDPIKPLPHQRVGVRRSASGDAIAALPQPGRGKA
jgi:hypothetical protein